MAEDDTVQLNGTKKPTKRLSTFLVKPNIFGEAIKTFKLKYVSKIN